MGAATIISALRRHFPHPDYGFATEVAQATGFNARRHLDAVIMDTWPSRGLEIMGVEVKVSRSDLARELAQPAKAEEIARFCNSFWLATPVGLVTDISTLPFSWGLFEIDGAGAVTRRVIAKRKDCEPVTKEFLAAMMRGARRQLDEQEWHAEAKDELVKERERLEADFDRRVAERSDHNSHNAKAYSALKEALGNEFRWLSNDEVVKALRVVLQAGLHSSWSGLQGLRQHIAEAGKNIDEAMTAAGFPPEPAPKRRKVGG